VVGGRGQGRDSVEAAAAWRVADCPPWGGVAGSPPRSPAARPAPRGAYVWAPRLGTLEHGPRLARRRSLMLPQVLRRLATGLFSPPGGALRSRPPMLASLAAPLASLPSRRAETSREAPVPAAARGARPGSRNGAVCSAARNAAHASPSGARGLGTSPLVLARGSPANHGKVPPGKMVGAPKGAGGGRRTHRFADAVIKVSRADGSIRGSTQTFHRVGTPAASGPVPRRVTPPPRQGPAATNYLFRVVAGRLAGRRVLDEPGPGRLRALSRDRLCPHPPPGPHELRRRPPGEPRGEGGGRRDPAGQAPGPPARPAPAPRRPGAPGNPRPPARAPARSPCSS